jgi:hypothetical protein
MVWYAVRERFADGGRRHRLNNAVRVVMEWHAFNIILMLVYKDLMFF